MENSTRKRGRPPGFDRDAVLDRAIALFIRVGYEGASIADLTAAMGITAQSLYAAFGSKEALYREALDAYAHGPDSLTMRVLEVEPDVVAAFTAMYAEAAARFTGRPDAPGCLIAGGSLACADEHRGLVDHLAELRGHGQTMFVARLERARTDGQLRRDADIPTLARFLGTVLQGFAIQARDGASCEALTAVGQLAVETLARYVVRD